MSPIRGRSEPKQSTSPDPDTMIYLEKRKRNNDAVKKSRSKAKEKTSDMEKRINALKTENDALEMKIVNVQKELDFLKTLFIGEAGRTESHTIEPETLENLLRETDDERQDEAVETLMRSISGTK